MTDTDWTNNAPETIGEALADKHLRIIKEAVTMTPTDDRLATNELAEIEALAKGVTPGPWEPASGATYEDGKPVITDWFVRRPDDDVAIAADILDPETIKPSEANAKFIARARTAVPGLLAHIRAQDAELARLRNDLAIIEQGCNSPWMTGAAFKDRVADIFASRALLDGADTPGEGGA